MGFDLLTEVWFRHPFFADNSFRDIRVLVPQQTAIEMRRYNLLFRRLPDRFLLLYDNSDADQRRLLLQDKLMLTFDIQLLDMSFYNYTGLVHSDISNSILLFTNQDGNAAGKLHKLETVSASEISPIEQQQGTGIAIKPFARIMLQLHPELLKKYEISFAAKTTRWCYFLMSADLAALTKPAIIDTTGKVLFSGPQAVELPGGLRTSVFISEEAVTLSQRPAHTFQLVSSIGDDSPQRVIIPALPTPDIHAVSAAGIPGYDRTYAYSEIFLY